MEIKKCEPPFKPKIKNEKDLKYFDEVIFIHFIYLLDVYKRDSKGYTNKSIQNS